MHAPAKDLIMAMLTWDLGLVAMCGLDYLLRQVLNKPQQLGLPEPVWFASHVLLAGCALWLLWRFWRNAGGQATRRLALVASCVMSGVIWYAATLWLYVHGSGIDGV